MANIIKVHKPEKYTVISNVPLHDPSISFRAKGLLCYLLSKHSGWEINVKQLASIGPDGRDAVYAILKELKESGYVVMTESRVEGKFMMYNYTVYEEKQLDPAPAPPLTDLPETVQPDTEKPTANGRTNRIRQSPTHSNYCIKENTDQVITEEEAPHKKAIIEKSIVDRKNEFKLMVISWYSQNPMKYPKLMLVKFVRHWTEQSLKKKKALLRFEDQEFFEVGKRLATWFGNSNDNEIRVNWECNERINSLEKLLENV